MRIVFDQQPIFAGGRLALVAVDENVFRSFRLLGNERPFHSGGEAGTSSTAQPRCLYFIDDVVGLHLQRFAGSFVAAEFNVAIDVLRAVAKTLRDNTNLVGM